MKEYDVATLSGLDGWKENTVQRRAVFGGKKVGDCLRRQVLESLIVGHHRASKPPRKGSEKC